MHVYKIIKRITVGRIQMKILLGFQLSQLMG